MTIRLDPEDSETKALHELADFNGKRILEIGCGDGRLTWRYADRAAQIVAIDPDADDIAAAIEDCPTHLRDRIEFRVSRIEDFEPPQELFDLTLLSWSL
jgi:2-polyprenyl-3-methyl-5-hydroxy-6-metoxy-1,4-benzoquinol methylase